MFFYEMHQHTNRCSLCGRVEVKELIKALAEQGVDGVVFTNHFRYGNTAIDRTLPFEDFCKEYIEDYQIGKEEAKKYGIDVFFGLEEHVGNAKEVLIYGLTPKGLLRHPDFYSGNLEKIYKAAHKENALVIQAHPFRERDYIPDPDLKLPPEFLDGYEVFNRGNTDEMNDKALKYAESSGKIIVAGSDSHDTDSGYYRFGIKCEKRIKDEKDLADILRNGEYIISNTRE